MKIEDNEIAYLVCCEPRVVLFGYATVVEIKKAKPTLKNCRMLVYWSVETKGVLGAAIDGPASGSKISKAIDEWTITKKVEGYGPCSEKAVKVFESGMWDE